MSSMSMKLSTEQHEEIYKVVKSCFGDFALFDTLVATKLAQALKESNFIDINEKSTKGVVARYFKVDEFRTDDEKALIYPLELIFQTAYVLVISHRDELKALKWPDVETLIGSYSQFANVDRDEKKYLLNYRNFLKMALTIIPAKGNKGRLLQIAGKLDGSRREYITGSGQKIEVIRRVQIYHQETGIRLVVKRPRKPKGTLYAEPHSSITIAAAVPSYYDAHSSVVSTEDGSVEDQHQHLVLVPRSTSAATPAVAPMAGPVADSKKDRKRKGGGPMVCTSSSFSHTKLKKMKISAGDVQKLVKKGGETHAEHFQQSLAAHSSKAPNVIEMDVEGHTTPMTTKGASLPPTPSFVNLRDPFAASSSRREGGAEKHSVDAATVSVQDWWDMATTTKDYFGTVEPPKRVPSRPSMTRESTFEAFFKDSGLLSSASNSMWSDFDAETLYGEGPPQLPRELSNEHLDLLLPPLPPAAERSTSLPLDLFSGLLSGEDLFAVY